MPEGPNINFVVRGTDDLTLIFVHGFGCSLDDWEEQFRALSPKFRCVALDVPGHGHSAKPEAISIESMGAAVNRVKDRVAARSTILVGQSMGCRVITNAFPAIDRAGMDAFTHQFFSDMFLESGRERAYHAGSRVGWKLP